MLIYFQKYNSPDTSFLHSEQYLLCILRTSFIYIFSLPLDHRLIWRVFSYIYLYYCRYCACLFKSLTLSICSLSIHNDTVECIFLCFSPFLSLSFICNLSWPLDKGSRHKDKTQYLIKHFIVSPSYSKQYI